MHGPGMGGGCRAMKLVAFHDLTKDDSDDQRLMAKNQASVIAAELAS